MSKTTTALVIVAAAVVVVAAVMMGRRRPTGMTGAGAGGPATSQQGNLADAFSGFVQAGTNWVAQWFQDRTKRPIEGTTSRPTPINEGGATVARPVGALPNIRTSPTYDA